METGTTFNYNRYIQKLASKYGMDKFDDDLKQVGHIGLHLAREKYDETKGDFHSFAQWYIVGEMKNWLTANSRTIRKPHSRNNEEENKFISTSQPLGIDSDETVGDMLFEVEEDNSFDDNDLLIRDLLGRYLDELKPSYQVVLKMRFYEEKTFNEISDELGTTTQNIALKYKNAIGKLKEKFGLNPEMNIRTKKIKPRLYRRKIKAL
ncbi:MAG TPA: sigma-70 family RNA polymerase sigma factor [Flavobacterium sp.]|uniref:sigma-70 family RNA polymerase sigma factor n=1 Tax=unclassified Flavobacterium TaxID=196869 RepID=UPI0025BAC287|nr:MULTISPECIES: sigma-70 family RNA polymerase sigma factor [unclassified Flavobacterium]HRE77120.1 sigma-70 family RNA polymerase sigma factor [Flavobacterium sp.]